VPKPFIVAEKCTLCGTCISSCPADDKAVNWFNGDHTKTPVYNYDKCIRCYCCQELCPESAIVLKYPLLRKTFKMLKISNRK
jgi:formate hydrogenlyase subunit 6/NADH:ubiquinone oxidoreductase subunit I